MPSGNSSSPERGDIPGGEKVNLDELKVGETRCLAEFDNAKSEALRVSEDEAVVRVMSKPDMKEVMVLKMEWGHRSAKFKKVDTEWWNVTLNGEPSRLEDIHGDFVVNMDIRNARLEFQQ